MVTHILFESRSGYSILEANGLDEIGQNIQAVRDSVIDIIRFSKVVHLSSFHPFHSSLDALSQINHLSEGIMTDELRNFLDLNFSGKSKSDVVLGLADSKLGASIFEETKIQCRSNEFVHELLRGVRFHFETFIKGLKGRDLEKAQLGLAHNYSRAKVKFNVNRVDCEDII